MSGWDVVYGVITDMMNEAYDSGQKDFRRALEKRLDSMKNDDSFSKDEIKGYLNEIGGKS